MAEGGKEGFYLIGFTKGSNFDLYRSRRHEDVVDQAVPPGRLLVH